MRWMRLILAVLLFSVVASCGNPVGPTYPQKEGDGEPPPEGEQQGFVVGEANTFWA